MRRKLTRCRRLYCMSRNWVTASCFSSSPKTRHSNNTTTTSCRAGRPLCRNLLRTAASTARYRPTLRYTSKKRGSARSACIRRITFGIVVKPWWPKKIYTANWLIEAKTIAMPTWRQRRTGSRTWGAWNNSPGRPFSRRRLRFLRMFKGVISGTCVTFRPRKTRLSDLAFRWVTGVNWQICSRGGSFLLASHQWLSTESPRTQRLCRFLATW